MGNRIDSWFSKKARLMTSPYAPERGGPYWGSHQPTPPPHYLPPPGPQSSGALAIIAFIGSLIAFFFGWVPFVGLGLGLLFLLLSVLAVLKPTLRGMAVAGIVLSTLATLTSLVTTGIVVLGMIGASNEPSSAGPSSSPSYTADDFEETDERTLSTIARDPDSHAGETLIVYGYISQFDANTGPCTMRLSISAEKRSSWVDYEHNALAYSGDGRSDCSDLDDVVEDDQVKLSVVLQGAESYSSMGGSTNVPHFEIHEVEVL